LRNFTEKRIVIHAPKGERTPPPQRNAIVKVEVVVDWPHDWSAQQIADYVKRDIALNSPVKKVGIIAVLDEKGNLMQ